MSKKASKEPLSYRKQLWKAVNRDNVDAARDIIAQHKSEVDINRRDKYDYSFLDIALNRNSLEMIKLLVENGGADIESENKWGHRALHVALHDGIVGMPIIRYLVEDRKADVNAQGTDSLRFTPLIAHCSENIDNIPIIRYMLDHGADPTIKGIHDYDAVDECNFNYYTEIGGCFAIATHPKYPLEKRGALNKQLEAKHAMKRPAAMGADKLKSLLAELAKTHRVPSINDIGVDGSPSPYACMLHVITMAYAFCDKDLSLTMEMLKNHDSDWIQQSQKLLTYPDQKFWDTQHMFKSYLEQVVLPASRWHVAPETLKSITDDDLEKITERLGQELKKEFIKDKNLFEILELSDHWHAHAATLDNNIRTIPREGKWYPLLAKGNKIAVPDTIAKGWTIRNVTNGTEVVALGHDLQMCIGGSVGECRTGKYHVFAFYNEHGKPSSTLRVSLADPGNEKDIAVKRGEKWLKIEDHTNLDNIRNFSKGDRASYRWLKEALKDGTIKLQFENIGETEESKKISSAHPAIEKAIGFPLSAENTDLLHQQAFEQWAWASNALEATGKPVKLPERTRPYDRQAMIDSGAYRRVSPNIGTHGKVKKYLIPEQYRDLSMKAYHYASGQDKILRNILGLYLGQEKLLPPEPFELPHVLRAKQRTDYSQHNPGKK